MANSSLLHLLGMQCVQCPLSYVPDSQHLHPPGCVCVLGGGGGGGGGSGGMGYEKTLLVHHS